MEFQRCAVSMQSSESPSPLIGRDPRMARLRHEIVRVATTDFTVLIEGESGSGKELVARQVHEQSTRRGGPFVAVNCAAIVDTLVEAELFGIEDRTATGVRGRAGKFELANEGTVFSTRSPTFRQRPRRSSCERCRSWRWSGSGPRYAAS